MTEVVLSRFGKRRISRLSSLLERTKPVSCIQLLWALIRGILIIRSRCQRSALLRNPVYCALPSLMDNELMISLVLNPTVSSLQLASRL